MCHLGSHMRDFHEIFYLRLEAYRETRNLVTIGHKYRELYMKTHYGLLLPATKHS